MGVSASSKNHAVSGALWTFGQILLERLAQAVVFLITARILGAEGFGIAAIAIAPAVVLSAALQSASQVIIRFEAESSDNRPYAFSACVMWGIVLSGINGLACLLILYFSASDAWQLAAVTTLVPLVYGLGCVSEAILLHEMKFKLLSLRRILGVSVGGALCVVFALLGFGPWAMVAQIFLTSIIATSVNLIGAGWRPRFAIHHIVFSLIARDIFLNATNNVLTQANARSIDVIVGITIGPASAGVYRISRTITDLVSSLFFNPLGNVLVPLLSKGANDTNRLKQTAEKWLILIAASASIGVISLVCGVFVVAPLATPSDAQAVILGTIALSPLLAVLPFTGLAQIVFLVTGSSSLNVKIGIGTLILVVASVSIASGFGLLWALSSTSLVFALSAIVSIAWLRKVVPIDAATILIALAVLGSAAILSGIFSAYHFDSAIVTDWRDLTGRYFLPLVAVFAAQSLALFAFDVAGVRSRVVKRLVRV